MTRKFMTRVLIALFALSLIGGMAVAQAAKKPAKAATAAAADADLLDINTATKDQRCSAGHRSGLLTEDHRWPSLRQEDGPDAEENPSGRHLQQNQRQDHRKTEIEVHGRDAEYAE